MQMTLHRFSDVSPKERSSLVRQLKEGLERVVPGLVLLERDFEVPGRGVQAAVAADRQGACWLMEFQLDAVDRWPAGLLDRLAWFGENRPLLGRLFPESPVAADPAVGAVLLAPAFSSAFLQAAANLPPTDIHLLRIRFLRAGAVVGFLLEDALDPDRPSPLAAAASPAPAAPAGPTPPGSIPAFQPARTPRPADLLARAEHWFSRLSPDITSRAEGDVTRFLFDGHLLAAMTVREDHLAIEVPHHGTFLARDAHELHRGINSVIKRYFGLVDPARSSRSHLKKEDILSERELAEFLDARP